MYHFRNNTFFQYLSIVANNYVATETSYNNVDNKEYGCHKYVCIYSYGLYIDSISIITEKCTFVKLGHTYIVNGRVWAGAQLLFVGARAPLYLSTCIAGIGSGAPNCRSALLFCRPRD